MNGFWEIKVSLIKVQMANCTLTLQGYNPTVHQGPPNMSLQTEQPDFNSTFLAVPS